MKKVILAGAMLACVALMFYMSRFQTDYYMNNHLSMSALTLLTIILVALHLTVYKK